MNKNWFSSAGKARLFYWITIAVSLLLLVLGSRYTTRDVTMFNPETSVTPIRARVTEVVSRDEKTHILDGTTEYNTVYVVFRAELQGGQQSGQIITATQSNEGTMAVEAKEVEAGDKVMVYYMQNPAIESEWIFADYIRTDTLLWLGGAFFLLLLLFGRRKGFSTMVSLALTCLAVFTVFLPSVLGGRNIYLWSSLTCLFVIAMTLLILGGPHPKTAVAVGGCCGGVLTAGLLTLLMQWALHLTGMVDEESVYLLYLNPESPIDLKAIIFAAVIIGALGAVMDVAVSIASALWEIRQQSGNPTFRLLMDSGFVIGQDMMGTMTNTLILAYIGGSLSVVLLLITYNGSLLGLLNREMIVVEILQALVGSIGMLLTIPLTTLLCAWLFPRGHKQLTE